ncbi:ParD-like family protein [bacterium]|nr:Arc family DNA-binding protein [Candidatus Omnitrophota bacterium]MBA3066401.1 Arc family DNA-binding protein [bacterium]MBU2529035.1 ParD-like family protein [bacterium]MBU3930204.1 ParD-like family protein [bacterium]MBU4122143.1 ParD-like family protein [bacterium]
MSKITTIRLPEQMREQLETQARLEHRSLSQQIKENLKIALAATANPDLPLQFIRDILEAKAEKETGGAVPFEI